jgi:hypothetical protein
MNILSGQRVTPTVLARETTVYYAVRTSAAE